MFWENYIAFCNEKGVKPNVAAAACGIKSSGTVTGWKNGSIPRQNVLVKLAKYFGCTTTDLLWDQKIPTTERDGDKSKSTINREELKRLVDRLTDQEVSEYLAEIRKTILGQ